MTYVIETRVVRLEEKSRVAGAKKVGDDVVVERETLGWFVLLEGSHEMLYLGRDQPSDLVVGQKVRIRIEPL